MDDNIDDLILSLADKNGASGGSRANSGSENATGHVRSSKSKSKSKKYISDSSEDEGGYSDDNNNQVSEDEDEDEVDEYGPDLYKDEEDRQRLLALPEVERERILSERSEERQRNLERLEVRKLLKDGRRDDTARRSTRDKGTNKSRALSELTRRREEKKSSRSAKRRHRESPSPERRKRRRSSYSDQSEYEQSDQEWAEEEAAEKIKKRVPTLEEIQSVGLTRQMIEKWLYAPFFEQTAAGCFVRIFIGPDPQKKMHVYRLCQILEIVPWHKVYKIAEGVWSNKAVKVKHGKAEKTFPMDIVSNQPVTQQEYARLIQTSEVEKVRLPTIDHVEKKLEDLKYAKGYVLNDQEVAEMIENKRAVKGTSKNSAMEKAQLLARLEHAKSNNEIDEVTRITKQLQDLDEHTNRWTDSQQNIWADLNKRNRERDRIEVQEVERRESEARRKALLAKHRAAQQSTPSNPAPVKMNGTNVPKAINTQDIEKSVSISKDAVEIGKKSAKSAYENLVGKIVADIQLDFSDDDD
ncbi:uncharacterized protein BYT42DRAFT_517636 [Radiomyces spectabilis]|uniref:uncharacterized protein n=1 Tax=Radiomyces spectabilis TaxID=64574 RepID=UPI00221F6846|nr:uncharacterized protein BYT42DRAFT_517636 [Radiomyces spectabilis]KAI8374117.1 hypothetical protein BYT42DRAFT_517636 [Radiomyces spectabilis]